MAEQEIVMVVVSKNPFCSVLALSCRIVGIDLYCIEIPRIMKADLLSAAESRAVQQRPLFWFDGQSPCNQSH